MNRHTISFIPIVLFLLSCGEERGRFQEVRVVGDSAPLAFEDVDLRGGRAFSTVSYRQNSVSQRLVIKTANISVQVENHDSTARRVQSIAVDFGGFIVESNVNVDQNGARTGRITLRTPSTKFTETLDAIKELALLVESETIRGNDVTEEFYDVQARLENKKRIEQRFRQILASAKTIADILAAEESLGRVREEIETLEGRHKYLRDQLDLSTIYITLRERQAVEGTGFLSKVRGGISRGFSEIGEVTGMLFEVLISGIPIWISLAALAYFIIRFMRRRKTKLTNA